MKTSFLLVLLSGVMACLISQAPAQQNVFQYGFENHDPIWAKGKSDVRYQEKSHRLTEEHAHGGTRSEAIDLDIEEEGTHFIYYTYDFGRASINEDLEVRLWVKATRPGIQLLCRVVLPRERDPKNLDQPLTVLLKGDTYEWTGRWQLLKLKQPVKQLRQARQLLSAAERRDVITADAYVDRLVLNLYAGPGRVQVYTDELEISPVDEIRSPAPAIAATVTPGRTVASGTATTDAPINHRSAEVQLNNGQLMVGGKKFFMRLIRHTGTPLKTLHAAGFNVVMLDDSTPPGLVEDAGNLGFWVIPSLRAPDESPGVTAGVSAMQRESFGKKVSYYLDKDLLLAWFLGSSLTQEQVPGVMRLAKAYHAADPTRPLVADVWDGFRDYTSGAIDQLMLGISRCPLMTSMELSGYRDWLTQRKLLAVPGTYCWTWIQTHLPDWYTSTVYGEKLPDGIEEPIGPQPEQIRLLTYTAIGSGYRGLGFWSDRYLADPKTSKDRLLSMALLNQELQMLEPILASAESLTWIDTGSPNVKAAVLRSDKALLVIPIWLGLGAQYVPGQASQPALDLVVPHVPDGTQCWEVSPGVIRSHPYKRVHGGCRVVLHEFSMTAALVFTTDLGPNGVLVHFQEHHRTVVQKAAQWAMDEAQEELRKVEAVEAQLVKMGHDLPDGTELLKKSRDYQESASNHWKNQEWTEAYSEAQRSLRPLRILMRAQWEAAVKKMTTPLASPYTLSFYTLPRHWQFWLEVQRGQPGANLIPAGNFETLPDQIQEGWLKQELPAPNDEVTTSVRRVTDDHEEGKQCLLLQILPKQPDNAPAVLERALIAVHSPAVKLPPGSLVRVSAWIRIPLTNIGATSEGLMFYDSAAGEQMGVRLTSTGDKWKNIVLYRRVPASGTINVTMALTGLGKAYVDDVRIEALLPGNAATSPGTALTAGTGR
jgi:hypothetical protein